MKTIGLIGGLTWYSTLDYYRLLNELVNERLGGAHAAKIISPISKIMSNNKVQAFVDDSRLFLIVPDINAPLIQSYLKQDVQTWEQFFKQREQN